MSTRGDMEAERTVADQFDTVRPPDKERKPGYRRRFMGDFLTGYAVAKTVRNIFR